MGKLRDILDRENKKAVGIVKKMNVVGSDSKPKVLKMGPGTGKVTITMD